MGVPRWDTTAPPTGTPVTADEPDVTPEEELDPDSAPPMSPKEAASGCLRVAKCFAEVMQVRACILRALEGGQ